jgi:hypothetical protein
LLMLKRDEFCFLFVLTKGVAGETLILGSGVWGGWSDPLFSDLLFDLYRFTDLITLYRARIQTAHILFNSGIFYVVYIEIIKQFIYYFIYLEIIYLT